MASAVKSYRDLEVWREALRLGLAVYAATERFPASERFGLTLQLRRSAVSVPSNIAEGHSRASTPDYARFLRIARGSLYEPDTQLEFAAALGYLEQANLEAMRSGLVKCSKMLTSLISKLE